MMNNKKICIVLSYIEHLLISDFASVVGIPIGITSSDVGLKVFAITAIIKMYKPIIKKKTKHDKTTLLAKTILPQFLRP